MTDMTDTEITITIKKIIAKGAEPQEDPESLSNDTLIFASQTEGGLELDSLSALEIFFAIGDAFGLPDLADANEATFQSVGTLIEFVQMAVRRDPVPPPR